MTAATQTLADFLLACIAEDEAHRVTRFRDGRLLSTPRELREADRWAAECEAKRRIVEVLQWDTHSSAPSGIDAQKVAHYALRALALPYADREGFRDEWRA